MRISDWSSDVCASDLATRGDHLAIQPLCRLELAQVIEQHRQVVPARRHVGVVVAQLRAARGDGLPVQRLAFLQLAGSPQHGAKVVAGTRYLQVVRAERLQAPRQHVTQHGFGVVVARSEEHTSELQSLMRISYAVFCLKKKQTTQPPLN